MRVSQVLIAVIVMSCTSNALFFDAIMKAAGLKKPEQVGPVTAPVKNATPVQAPLPIVPAQPPQQPPAPVQPQQVPPPARFAYWRSQQLVPNLWSPSSWPYIVSQVPISPSQVVQNIGDIVDAPIIVGSGYAFRPE